MNTIKYRLGLDVGTNSLGWSVLELDGKGQPCRIEAAGARIFSEGRNPKSKATLAATRRVARQARRRRDRFKQRQRFLLAELTKVGLFPKDKDERKSLQLLNPLELRSRALTEKLKPYEIGRALFHMNQRRGFKSNRKDRSEETTSGKVANSYRALLEEMELIGERLVGTEEYKALSREEKKDARHKEIASRQTALKALTERKDLTYGAFLWQRQTANKQTRARPGAGDDGKLYDVYPIRELYEDEFNKIWQAQAKHHPKLMTDEWQRRIHQIIFTQRPLKPQERGRCTYLHDELRTFRAMPSFQRYRIYQQVNSLEWMDDNGVRRRLVDSDHRQARDKIIQLLERPQLKEKPNHRNARVAFSKMKRILKELDLAQGNFEFNFETPGVTGFDGDQTANVMQHEDYLGDIWHSWSLDEQDKFITVIQDDKKTDEEVRDILMEKYSLTLAAAENCLNAPLVEGTANISTKAACLMMEIMRDGVEKDGELKLLMQNEAATYLGECVPEFTDPMRRPKCSEQEYKPQTRLPYYGEAFQDGSHIIPGTRDPDDKWDERKFFGGVTNPTVHIALNQIRQLVNEVISNYGHPESIAIELARDLPAGAEGRSEIEKEQRNNQKRNEKIDEKLAECNQEINRDNRIRIRLWEELSEDPNGRFCLFSGKKIGIHDLFSDKVEVEHLIPFSQSLDDSYANKVICSRRANRDKGQRTPYEAFHDNPTGYDWEQILERAKNLSRSKQWRFLENARDIWNRDNDFSERHLNDTRYIGRLAREYLELVCYIDKIDVLTGRLTGLLRGFWGLNGLLSEGDQKSRDDHRHHAVDAIVIGMISRPMLQKVSAAANRAEKLEVGRLFKSREIDPWDEFRTEVSTVIENIIVSHKQSRKKLRPGATDGQLHNDTAYGLVSKPDGKSTYEVVVRKPINEFQKASDIEAIRDGTLRRKFKAAFEKASKGGKGEDGVKRLAKDLGIRSLRRVEALKVIPVHNRGGEPYKFYKGDSNWGMEIYAYPKGHQKAGEWEGIVISRFDANQRKFKPGETCRPHPAARLVMRLQINDYIKVEENEEVKIYRLQYMVGGGGLFFAPPNEANVDARNRDSDNSFNYVRKSVRQLQSLNARKVHLSPMGKVSYEKRPCP
ncbi:MAG: type II CRISPR RNA-guided endonuclease Cas9 [Pseudohongiellaceae bacterium]